MRPLYPALQPNRSFRLAVQSPHELYVEEAGNASGLPVLFVHGGPGSGCEDYHRCFFNPEYYRIILFDQRGSGKSTPHAELQHNNTQALVEDMEAIREHLGIDQWVLFGGSWGSTLSLVYAETHPERVLGLILRGIFLCRPREIQWFYQSGANRIFPDLWEHFISPIPEAERRDLINAYYHRLTGDDELARMAAAKAWSLWEGNAATLRTSASVIDHFGDPHVALALARIECHYFKHNAFLEDNQILRRAHQLKDIPGTIVQGRYDIICPMESAWQLHQAWPMSELNIIPDAGHAASEPGIVDALVHATDNMIKRLT
jgi:proline iminopeptidase